jgi:hypothetical protein
MYNLHLLYYNIITFIICIHDLHLLYYNIITFMILMYNNFYKFYKFYNIHDNNFYNSHLLYYKAAYNGL